MTSSCPNCGAPFGFGAVCEYCGTPKTGSVQIEAGVPITVSYKAGEKTFSFRILPSQLSMTAVYDNTDLYADDVVYSTRCVYDGTDVVIEGRLVPMKERDMVYIVEEKG